MQSRAARIVVVLALAAVLCGQAASLSTEYFHHHFSDHCCVLCHAGPFPFVQPAAPAAAAPALWTTWLERSIDFASPREPQLVAGSSRAPPA
ncbi:MAG: hypothetical protein LAQ30_09360 [Acidobacteriia bacterium]|nr:hypothetical protein [Terriglobia bacterium]